MQVSFQCQVLSLCWAFLNGILSFILLLYTVITLFHVDVRLIVSRVRIADFLDAAMLSKLHSPNASQYTFLNKTDNLNHAFIKTCIYVDTGISYRLVLREKNQPKLKFKLLFLVLIVILTTITVNILVPQINGCHYNVFVRLAFESQNVKFTWFQQVWISSDRHSCLFL